jgi:hypothetical protein
MVREKSGIAAKMTLLFLWGTVGVMLYMAVRVDYMLLLI